MQNSLPECRQSVRQALCQAMRQASSYALYAKLLFMGPGTMRANDPQPLQEFENKWARGGEDSLVMDKWFALQATAAVPGALGRVRELMAHPRFSMSNPNKVCALFVL
jgi:aminopeptidase N